MAQIEDVVKVVVEEKNAPKHQSATKELKEETTEFKKSTKAIDENAKARKNDENATTKLNGTIIESIKNIKIVINVAKKVFDVTEKLVEKQSDYIENLNLLQNAFGDTTQEALKYVDTLGNLYGFDESSLTKSLGLFRQLADAMGLTSDIADKLSYNLQSMALDISSLYNVSIERSANALQSALTGNIKSIRSLTGADITQATLQQKAYTLGIEESITTMNRAEKAMLIYLTLADQLANAQGDMTRTINGTANQLKIFKDQCAELARNIGGLLLPIFREVLYYLNGILMVLNEVIGAILSFFGIGAIKMADEFGVATNDMIDYIDELSNSASSGSAKMQKSLRGFDRLNNLSSQKGGRGATGVSPNDLTTFKKLQDLMGDYNGHLDNVRNKAVEIRDSVMSWLGFTKEIDEETGKITWKYIGLERHLGNFGKALKKIFDLQIKSVKEFGKEMGKLLSGTFEKILPSLTNSFKNIKSFWDTFWEDLANTIDTYEEDIIKSQIDLISSIYTDFIEPIVVLITSVWEGFTKAIKDVWDKYGKDILNELAKFIVNTQKLFKKLWDNILSPIIIPFFEALQYLWDNYFKDTVKKVGELVALLIRDALRIYNNVIVPVLSWITDKLQPAFKFLGESLKSSLSGIGKIASTSVNTLIDVLKGLNKFVKGTFTGDWKLAWSGVKDVFSSVFNSLKSIFAKPLNWIIDKLNKFIDQINKVKIPSWVPEIGGKGFNIKKLDKIEVKEHGGFVNNGDLFIANEKEAEMVGKIGTRTAVANNDQIVESISIGVAKANMATKQTQPVIIEAKGDASGLLDFITFKQKEKSRQFGL